jgi:hypothetical protein
VAGCCWKLEFLGEEDDPGAFEVPYVVTLCDNKELSGQDTFLIMGGEPGEVFWTTSFDPEEDFFDGGSVNITRPAPSSPPTTSPSHGSKKSKKEGGKAGKAGGKKEGGKAGKAGSYKEGGKVRGR